MHTRCARGERHISARVHYNFRAMRILQLARRLHQLEECSGAQMFLTNLYPCDTRGKISRDCIEQRLAGQSPGVGYITPDHRTPRFLSAFRTRDSSMPK